MSLLRFARSVLHGRDSRIAAKDERRAIRRSLDRGRTSSGPPWDASPGVAAIEIGTLDDGSTVRFPLEAFNQHALAAAPTGGGKTAEDSLRGVEALKAGITSVVMWANSKPDLVSYFRAGLAHYLSTLPPGEARAWLRRVVVLAPTSEKYLLPLQLLSLPEGADSELLVMDIVSSFGALADAAMGVVQEDLFADGTALLCELQLPITMLVRLLRDAGAIATLARRTRNPERFLAFADRVRAQARSERIAGLASRLNRITRLRNLRLMLNADRMVDFPALLSGDKIVLIDMSVAEHGLEAAASFIGRVLWTRFARAMLSRPIASPCLPVFVDEFQELLTVGPSVDADLDRLLRLSRARGGYVNLSTQTLSGLSATLRDVLNVNVSLTFNFRGADPIDAVLPVTGRAVRAPGLPWEERRGSYFLSKAEELSQIRARLATLPNRRCFVHDASTGRPGFFMKTADAKLAMPPNCDPEIVDGLARGTLSVSETELVRCVERNERRLAELLGGSAVPETSDISEGPVEISTSATSSSPSAPVLLRRRPPGTVGIG